MMPNSQVWGVTGLSVPTPFGFGYVGVPNNRYWGRSTKINGRLDPSIPRKSDWIQVQ